MLLPPAPATLSPEDWRRIAALWRDALETSAADGVSAAHILGRLQSFGGAERGFLIFARRDMHNPHVGIDGWLVHDWLAPRHSAAEQRKIQEMVRRREYVRVRDVREQVAAAGRERAHLQRLDAGHHDPWLRDLLDAIDVGSRLVTVLPLTPQVELYLTLDRGRSERPFSEGEARRIITGLNGLARHARGAAVGRGVLPHGQLLTRRERELVPLLLTGLSEKEIASEVHLTPRSTHQVVVHIYRKLGVRSRAELMSLIQT